MNIRQTPVIGQLFLLAALGLVGCSETKNWTLSYAATSPEAPDLVLVFRIDGSGGSSALKANFDTSSGDVNFQPVELKTLLESCADQAGAVSRPACVQLADHIGSVLFKGAPKVFNPTQPSSNKSGSISVSGSTSRFFVVFLYRMNEDTPATDERCLKLESADRQGSGFTVEGGTGKNIRIELNRGSISGSLENRDCFPLGI